MTIPLAVGIAVAVNSLVLGALLILRRIGPPEGFWGKPEPNHSGSAMAVLGSAFAILVAFVMFLAFQSYLNARESVHEEATATKHMFEIADLFPRAIGEPLHSSVVCYARAVVRDEWPKMEEAERSEVVDDWALRLERTAERVDFDDARQGQAYSDWADLDRVREDSRAQRLAEAEPFVPALLWVALIAGGVLLVGYVCTFANRSIRFPLQAALVIAIATIGTLNLCVVRFLDTPYEDVAGSLQPESMEESLAAMESELDERLPGVAPECDQSGQPARQS